MNQTLWLALGDSITEGYAANGELWVNHVAKDAKLRIHNLGISGDTTEDLAERAPTEIKARAKLANVSSILFIGTNDCSTRLSDGRKPPTDAEFTTQIETIIAAAKKYSERVLLVELVGIATDNDLLFEGGNQRKYIYHPDQLKQKNEIIRSLAVTPELELVHLYDDFQTYRDKLFGDDGLHPNENGQKFIAKRIAGVISAT